MSLNVLDSGCSFLCLNIYLYQTAPKNYNDNYYCGLESEGAALNQRMFILQFSQHYMQQTALSYMKIYYSSEKYSIVKSEISNIQDLKNNGLILFK